MSDSRVDLQLPLETRNAEMIDELLPSDGEHELDGVPLADDLSPQELCNDSDMESDACEGMPPPPPFYNRDFQFTVAVQLEGRYSESVSMSADSSKGSSMRFLTIAHS